MQGWKTARFQKVCDCRLQGVELHDRRNAFEDARSRYAWYSKRRRVIWPTTGSSSETTGAQEQEADGRDVLTVTKTEADKAY